MDLVGHVKSLGLIWVRWEAIEGFGVKEAHVLTRLLCCAEDGLEGARRQQGGRSGVCEQCGPGMRVASGRASLCPDWEVRRCRICHLITQWLTEVWEDNRTFPLAYPCFVRENVVQLNERPTEFNRCLCCCRITVVPRRLHEGLFLKEGDSGSLDGLILQCGGSASQVFSIPGPASLSASGASWRSPPPASPTTCFLAPCAYFRWKAKNCGL